MTELPHNNRRAAYLAARGRLTDAVNAAAADNVTISVADARSLQTAYPPDSDPLDAWCNFDARFVPFLRNIRATEMWAAECWGGITITPHRDGGAVLCATDGAVMLLARDPSARVSKGGVRLLLPDAALDACVPPKPAELLFEGEWSSVQADPPAWTIPDRVYSSNGTVMVIPAGNPEQNDPENWGMLWVGNVTTSHRWRDGDVRMMADLAPWQAAVERLLRGRDDGPKPLRNIALSSQVLGIIAKATDAIPALPRGGRYFQVEDMGNAISLVPTHRDDIAIIAMKCKADREPGLPTFVTRNGDSGEGA